MRQFREWIPRGRDFARFEKWRLLAKEAHEEFRFLDGQAIPPLASPAAPVGEWKVALVSTAGIHRDDQESFDTRSAKGDWSYRVIPDDTPSWRLRVSHSHFNHTAADKDITCLFPLERLRELVDDGKIGAVASANFGLMGFVPNPAQLQETTAPEIARRLQAQAVDAVIMTPG